MLKKIAQSVSKLATMEETMVSMLKNGMIIATEETKSPLTCASLVVNVGSRYETCCTNGLTHFIEHMAFKGFKSMNREELENEVALMSAKMTVHTSREMQVFSVILPSEHATTGIGQLFKIIHDLDLQNYQMDLERYNIGLELADSDINPKHVVFDYLHATAFQGTPLAQRVIGTSDNIATFNASATADFMTYHYQPHRLILATSGNITHDVINAFSEERIGCLPSSQNCKPKEGPSRFTGSQVLYRDDSMPFCHVAIAFEAPGYCSPHYYTMLLMKHIVGSWDRRQGLGEGNAPLVARYLATNNLCERYEAFYITYRDVGLWGVYFIADKWKLDEIVYHVQDQWMHLCTIVRLTDMERGKNSLRMELAKRYDSVVSSSRDIGIQMLYTRQRKSLFTLYKELWNIKLEHVRSLADKCLYDRCPAVAVMGPSETLPSYARIRSGQWWLRL